MSPVAKKHGCGNVPAASCKEEPLQKGCELAMTRGRIGLQAILLVWLVVLFSPAWAQQQTAPAAFAPHFRSLAADKVYMRSGPGMDYPVQWIYRRKGLPLFVIDQFEAWLQVRDRDGTEGWIHQRLMTRSRRAVVIGSVRTVFADPDAETPRFRAVPGVVAALLACQRKMCFIQVDGREGWIPRNHIFGVIEGEDFE